MSWLRKTFPAGLLALFVAGQLYAQPTSTAPAKESTPPRAPLSPEQMRERGATFQAQIRVDIQRVQHLQSIARREKDVIKLSCVNDKFIRLKAESNIFDASHREMLGVIDTDARFAAFKNVERAADASHKAREEAEACLGESDLTPTNSNTTVTPPEIIDNPTVGGTPFPGGVDIEPPAYASPYS